MFQINIVKSNQFLIVFLFSSIIIHSWTIVIYASDYLSNPAPTVCFPIISDFLWMLFNDDCPRYSGRGFNTNQYDIVVSVYLVVLALYFLFNKSTAIKCVAFLYIYFLVWFMIFCLLSFFGLLGYSSNTTNQFDNIGYTAYYFEALLYSKDWLALYAVTMGWWMSFIPTWFYFNQQK